MATSALPHWAASPSGVSPACPLLDWPQPASPRSQLRLTIRVAERGVPAGGEEEADGVGVPALGRPRQQRRPARAPGVR